jgi:2-oxoglutarate ferredoxin oxidoreductase subunit delta
MTIAPGLDQIGARTNERTDPRNASAEPPTGFVPLTIDADRCKACGLCIDVCARHVLALDPVVVNALGYHPIRLTDPAGCTSCALCARICPDAVYTVFARPKGG